MSLFFADLVREASHGTGTGDLPLEGALPGHRRFADAVPAGARFHYCIAGVTNPDEWETGEGEIGSGGALIRLPLASSAGAATVNFSAGLKTVALTVAAAWYTDQEAEGDLAGLQAQIDGKQPLDAELSAIASLAAAPDSLPFFTGPGAAALTGFSVFGRTLVDDPDAGSARATLGLGTLATQDAGAVAVTGGTVTGISSLDTAGTISSSAPLILSSTAGGVQTIRASGPGSKLALEQTGGQYGTTRLTLTNQPGENGAVFENMSAEATLVDFQFQTSLTGTHGIRYERRSGHFVPGNEVWEMQFGAAGTPTFSVGDGCANFAVPIKNGGIQVLSGRRTGWSAPTGSAARTSFETATVTTSELAERVKALIEDLTAHGLIGS